MKLAEGLLLRADLQKKIAQLTERIKPVIAVKEGETPHEDAVKLLAKLRKTVANFEAIIVRINRTNMATNLLDGRTLMEGLARRDALKLLLAQIRVVRHSAAQAGIIKSRLGTYRTTPVVKVSNLQSEIDQISREFRELDTQIQGLNWTTELLE